MSYGTSGYGSNLFSSFPSLAAQSAAAPSPVVPSATGAGYPATGVPSASPVGLPGGGQGFSTSLFANNFPAVQQDVGSLIGQAETGALPYYTSGIGALQQYYGQAAKPFQQLIRQAKPEVQQYQAMTGALGAGPQQEAIKAFMVNPELQSQMQLGDAASNAAAAAAGNTGSGTQTVALDRFNQQLGSQLWNQQLAALQPFLQQMQTAQAGKSAVLGTEGQGVAGGLNTIGGMMVGLPTTEANYLSQLGIGAQNTSSGYLADLAGLGSGLFQGLGALGGGLLKSDVNAKENIEPVGKLADGMNIYRYSYKDDPTSTPHIGLLAQEVEQVAPDAVGLFSDGMKGVNYARATDRAAALMKFANDNVSAPLVVYGEGLMELAA